MEKYRQALPAEIWGLILADRIIQSDARILARLMLVLQHNAHLVSSSITHLLYTKYITVRDIHSFSALFPKLTSMSVCVGGWDLPKLKNLPSTLRSLTLNMGEQNLFGVENAPAHEFAFLHRLTKLEELVFECVPNRSSSKYDNRIWINLKHVFASFSTASSGNLPGSLRTLRFLHNQSANLNLDAPLPRNLTAFENHSKAVMNFKDASFLSPNLVELRLPEVRGSFALLVGSRAQQLPRSLRIIAVHCSATSSSISVAEAAAWPRELNTLEITFAEGHAFVNMFTPEIWKAAPQNIEHLVLANFPAPTTLPAGLKTLTANFNVNEAFPNFPETLEELNLTNPGTGYPLPLSHAFVQSFPPRLRALSRPRSVVKFDRIAWEALSETMKEFFVTFHPNSVVRHAK
jgi:hypothetical protein